MFFMKPKKGKNAAWRATMKKLNADLAAQDRQIAMVQDAEDRYKRTGDLEGYIQFWELLWSNGGLLFHSSKWGFALPDLYFKQKRYDDVIAFCRMLKAHDSCYADKADKYIQKAITKKENLKPVK